MPSAHLNTALRLLQAEQARAVAGLPKPARQDYYIGLRKQTVNLWAELEAKYRTPETTLCASLALAIQYTKNSLDAYREKQTQEQPRDLSLKKHRETP